MLFRIPAVAAGLLLSAVSIPAQTFTIHTYASNNLWNINGGPNAHVFADLNEDGREDFVSLNDGSFNSLCSGSFAVALSNGDGSYVRPVCYSTPGTAMYFATGDFTGNGTLDLAVTNDLGQALIYLNDGAGALTLSDTISLDGEARGIAAADVNHDGRIDLVYDTTSSSGTCTLHVLFGDGRGGFTAGRATDFPMDPPAWALEVGDFDSDGHADILVTRESGNEPESEILYGDGLGDFTTSPLVVQGWTRYQVFDIDGNGTSDLIGAPFLDYGNGNHGYFTSLVIERGNANRTLTRAQVTLKGCDVFGGAPPQVADFDGDGIPDIVVAEASDCIQGPPFTLNFMKGNGDGTFQPEKVIFQTNDWIGEWHVMRATHSSRPDLAVWESESTNHTNWNTEQLVLVNMTAGNFPACTPPNFSATGVNHCGPTSSVGATSPVTFKFAGANPTAGRDMELWIDGKKVTQKFKHSFSHYDFLQQTVTLANGEHKVSVVSVGWDYSLIRDAFTLKVGSSVCPLPGGSGLNVCSPLQNSTVPASQPVSAYVRGKVPSGNAITRMELWVDGVKKYVTYGSNTLKTALSLSPGQHKLAYVLVDNAGTTWSDAYDVAAQ